MSSRGATFSAALAVLALAATAAPAAANRCRPQVIDLGTLPGSSRSVALATNAAHEVVGYSDFPDDSWHAFRWANGRMRDLGLPGPGSNEAMGINAAGTIVGRVHQNLGDDNAERGFVWRDGRVSILPGLVAGGHTQARTINTFGVIGGSAWNAAGQERAMLWVLGHPVELGVPAGYSGAFVIDVSDSGDAVGIAYQEGAPDAAFRWRLGRFQVLPPLPGGTDSRGTGAGVFGDASGTTLRPNGPAATVWDRAGKPHALGFLGKGDISFIQATDGVGGYIGGANLFPGDRSAHVFVARLGGPLKMLPAIGGPQGQGGGLSLTPQGDAAGSSEPAGGGEHATLWTCVWEQAILPKG